MSTVRRRVGRLRQSQKALSACARRRCRRIDQILAMSDIAAVLRACPQDHAPQAMIAANRVAVTGAILATLAEAQIAWANDAVPAAELDAKTDGRAQRVLGEGSTAIEKHAPNCTGR